MNASPVRAWLLFAISTIGMLLFATLFFLKPKSPGVIHAEPQIVTNTVVNTVTKEVPMEVEKIVKVPAAIPEEYIAAMRFWQNFTNITFASQEQVLFKMKDVSVKFILSDSVLKVISLDEIKAKFELTLRRNNVPINSKSQNEVLFVIDGFYGDIPATKELLTYSVRCELFEKQWVFRGGEVRSAAVAVWAASGYFGHAGKERASAALLEKVEKYAERFANDYLSANSKPE